MRIIKLALISLFMFALLITGISLFFPSHIRISKAIDITAGRDSVWRQVTTASNWKNWYPRGDSLPPLFIDGKIKGIHTDSVQGLMLLTSSDSTVTAIPVGPGAGHSATGWNVYASYTPNTITIQWYMDFRLKWYPWEKFSSLLLENRYGPLMEKGLENLKAYCEKK
jgi:Polyketide cyclase / dehydrase and lipid transport